jgi:hypothetical protein
MKMYKRLFEEKIPKAPAYWIDPTGSVLPIFNDDRHINQILKRPEAFGLDLDEIQQLYSLENEEIGSEGKAREKIIKELIQRGWIRIRHYIKQDMFTVNIFRLHKKAKDILYRWALAMKDNGLKYSQVKIDLPNQVLSYSIDDISKDVLFAERKNKDKLKDVLFAERKNKDKLKVVSLNNLPPLKIMSLFSK